MSYFLENWEDLPYLQMNMTSRTQNYLLDCFTVQIMITYKNVKTNRKKLLIRSGINFLINCEVFEIVEHCKGPWCPVETKDVIVELNQATNHERFPYCSPGETT